MSTAQGVFLVAIMVLGLVAMIAVPLHLEKRRALQSAATVTKLYAAARTSTDRRLRPADTERFEVAEVADWGEFTIHYTPSPPSMARNGDVWTWDGEQVRVRRGGYWVHNVGPGAPNLVAAIQAARDNADGLVTYEQVTRWVADDVLAAIEAAWPEELRPAVDGRGRPDDGLRHGTVGAYLTGDGCRCQPCVDAHREYQAARRAYLSRTT